MDERVLHVKRDRERILELELDGLYVYAGRGRCPT
jgi:hypothetical protein